MPFQPAPGVAKIAMNYSWANEQCISTFHVKTDAAWSAEFVENLANVCVQWFQLIGRDVMSEQVTLISVQVRDLSTEFAAYFEAFPVVDNVGTLTSPSLPMNVALAVKWTTGLTGRSTRGRTFHPGLTEADAVNGTIVEASRLAIVAAYRALFEGINAEDSDWHMSVLSRVQDGVPLAEAIAYEILDLGADTLLDSMRKRLVGRGA